MELERITPEQAGLPSQKILDFMEGCKKRGLELHSLMFLRHGKVFAESWWKPYNKTSPHIMFSFTKSLTSTAIGFACQEKLLSIEERLVDIFPDKIPSEPSENLKNCRVKHLLMMGCGHREEIPNLGMGDPDWISAFLHHPFVYEPGTKFMYNTAGTNLLCAILKRKTGMDMTEFLTPRLFEPIGMGEVPCYFLPDGTQMGGAGSRLTTEQMARFIQFVANRGTWEGKRLLEESWFDLATTKQIENAETSLWADWQRGYGFQFWQCVPEGVFRADGAFGQFGVVYPQADAVFVITSASPNFNEVLTVLWDTMIGNFGEELPENREMNQILSYVLSHNEITPLYSSRILWAEQKYSGSRYRPDKPITGCWADLLGGAGISSRDSLKGIVPPYSQEEMTEIKVEFLPQSAVLTALVGGREEILPISMESGFNRFTLSGKTYGAVGAWHAPDTFEFLVRCAEAATGKRYTLRFEENGLAVSARSDYPECGGLNDYEEPDRHFTLINSYTEDGVKNINGLPFRENS